MQNSTAAEPRFGWQHCRPMMSEESEMAHPDRYDVRVARLEEAADLAETLARAFYSDPVVSWVIPSSSRRMAMTRRGSDLYLRRVWLRHEETYTAGSSAGVCVWEPPGAWKLGARERLSLLP